MKKFIDKLREAPLELIDEMIERDKKMIETMQRDIATMQRVRDERASIQLRKQFFSSETNEPLIKNGGKGR